MFSHNDYLYLCHMRDACLKVQQYVAGFTWELFGSDSRTQDAVIRQLEIIGEASSKLSQEYKDSNEVIPWRAVKAFRNVAIHDYDRIMPDRVWKLTQKDLPEMINQLETLIERQKEKAQVSGQEKEKGN